MRAPTTEKILIDISTFMSLGEEFARAYPQNELSALIKSAARLGVDAKWVISDVLADLNLIQRHLGKLRRIWTILVTRCVVIWTGVMIVRGVLLNALDTGAWMVWSRTDRLLLVSALFLTVTLIVSLINRYLMRGWGPSIQNRVWSSVCHYVTMGQGHIGCLELRQNLKKIVLDEWRTGVSGESARLVLLKNRISSIGDDIDHECMALAAVSAGAELSLFAIGFMGFNFAPLMAWMESASGVN